MIGQGYTGRILRVDLSRRTITTQELDEATARKYIGGAGLAAKILWDETDATTPALSAENPLLFLVGPLTGTRVPTSGRYTIAAISPQTGIWGESHIGGTWGYALKCAGFDAIVVHGAADTPVYLWVNDGKAEIRDAHHLWGTDTYELDRLLKKETDIGASVAGIGQAGEKLVKFAAIMGDGPRASAAARSGMGAVMGFKKLKAIAVKGTMRPHVHDKEKLISSIRKHFPQTLPGLSDLSKERRWTSFKMMVLEVGAVKNWQWGDFEGFGDKFAKVMTIQGKPSPCRGCPVACFLLSNVGGQKHVPGEFLIPIGSNCLIDDMDELVKAFGMCNRYGLDAITTGHVVAMAMELYDRGIITKNDTDGIDLRWGNQRMVLDIVRKIGEREGFGELLGEGVRGMAERIGGAAFECAIHVKGLEPPMLDARSNNAWALQYATGNRGADHMEGFMALYRRRYAQPNLTGDEEAQEAASNPFATKGVGRLTAWAQNLDCVMDSLVLCKYLAFPFVWMREAPQSFVGIQPTELLEWLNLATGWDMNMKEFLETGERIFNLKRLFNVRRGIRRKDDTLPARLLNEIRGGGGKAAQNLPPLEAMINEYYAHRRWHENGIPTKEKLSELGLPSYCI